MQRNRWVFNKEDKKFYQIDEWKKILAAREPLRKSDNDELERIMRDWEARQAVGSRRYVYCKVKGKVVPEGEQVQKAAPTKHVGIAHGFIQDEMEATKHPCDKKYYTSKSKFRAVTKAHGREEIGTAYSNGYEPEREQIADQKRYEQRLHEVFRERLNGTGRR